MNDNEVKEALRLIGERYKKDWVFYVEHGLGLWTWSKMREIIRSVQDDRKTIVVSCHGSSKTFTGALLVNIFLNIYMTFAPEEKTKVITTAPTFMQVESLLWSEVGQIHRNSRTELHGECLTTKIKTDNKDCFAIGFSTDKPEKSEGWHAWNLFFVLDEGKGIAPWMWETVSAQSGGGNSKVLVLSTTDGVEPGSEFHNAATSPRYSEWNRIFIDCKDLPSFTGEKFQRYKWNDASGLDFEKEERSFDDLRIQISTPEWEEERKKQWGKDSVLYLTKCRGQIIDELPDQIIPLWKVEKMYANYEDPNFDDTGTEEVGIDAARMGKDSSCGWRRKGMKFFPPAKLNKKEAYEVIDHYEKVGILTSKDIKIKNDDTGVGGAVTGDLKRRGYTNIVPVCFNQEPNDKDHYEMAIDEMWFTFEEVMQDYACPRNDQLTKQLTSRKSTKMTKKGQRKVEPKDDYKARMNGESCDEADGLLLAWYTPVKKEKEGGFEIPDVRIY